MGTLIPIGKYGQFEAVVDDRDAEKVRSYRWSFKRDKHTVYAYSWDVDRVSKKKRRIWMHHVVLGDTKMVDHKDGNGLNNQRSNLRPATSAQNMANRRSSFGPYKGVTLRSDNGKWQARIKVGDKNIGLGSFDDAGAAAKRYDAAAWILHGEFAKLNIPPVDLLTLKEVGEVFRRTISIGHPTRETC